jgi:glutamate synthase (NADPH/NADH) small chain
MIAEPLTDLPRGFDGTPQHAFVHINRERCAGCQECIIRCPTGALTLDSENWIAQANDDLCVGCRQCERVCPFTAVAVTGPVVVAARQEPAPLHLDSILGDTSEVRQGFSGWPHALLEADRCLNCPDPTCMEGCPAHNDIPGFISAMRERNLEKAHEILQETSILPDICSRVCDQSVQCEGACSWALAGERPVSIGLLERFVADNRTVPAVKRASKNGYGLSVTVVGSGPAGCAAAWELLQAGATVRMLEKDAVPGGVLQWGIPSFTLPDAPMQRPIEALLNAGLRLQTSCTVGNDISLDALLADDDAVILAHGASQPIVPPIPGRELDGVEDAREFLERGKQALREGRSLPEVGAGAHVLVLGGGNTAMDVARTVRRFGGEVTTVEWMDERFARVRPDELEEARGEGVTIRFTTTVERLAGIDGWVCSAMLRQTRQDRVDRLPRVLRGAPERMIVSRVIFALGYRVDAELAADFVSLPLPHVDQSRTIPDRRWTASGIPSKSPAQVGSQALSREVGLAVAASPTRAGWWVRLRNRSTKPDSFFRATSWQTLWRRQAAGGLAAAPTSYDDRVWVAGDALVGPSTVVGAMAQGREAARAVLKMRPTRELIPIGIAARRAH